MKNCKDCLHYNEDMSNHYNRCKLVSINCINSKPGSSYHPYYMTKELKDLAAKVRI